MIRVLFSAGTAAAANGITADVDVLLDAGGAGSAGDDFTVNLTLDEGSASIQLMPPSVNLVITGIAPLVSAGVGISLPAAAYSIAGLAPGVRSVLAVRVPLGEFELVPAAPTIATGASVSPAALALGISAVAPEAVGPLSDPDFASVSLLLPLNGANGSTVFTDASINSFTITRAGDAQISTAQSKWAGSSLLLDGTGDTLSTPVSTAFNLTSDFTVEAWIRPVITTGFRTQVHVHGGANRGVHIWFVDDRLYMDNGVDSGGYEGPVGGIVAGMWYHIAMCKLGGTTYYFKNGDLLSSLPAQNHGTPNRVLIGRFFPGGTLDANSYFNDIRITKGIARYTANFTPPTEPFPTS
jgi:hypothetical protein